MMVERRAFLTGALIVSALLARAAGTAESTQFETRWKLAEANRHTDSGHEFVEGVFFKEFNSKFFLHVNKCTQQTGERLASDSFRAVFELAASGKVLDVTVESPSRPADCFARLVEKDIFPKPPSDHYLVPVEIRFTNQ